MAERVIFHVDVNSAFLSWTAAYRCRVLGQSLDLRQVPAVVASQADVRRSIVLAKSAPAKAFGIHTGDQLLLLGDEGRGLALLHQRDLIRFAEAAGIFSSEDRL